MSVLDTIVVVVVVAAGCLLAASLRVLWYRRMSTSQRAALAGTELRHYTSHAAGVRINQGDGTVALTPRGGWRGGLAELAHQNWYCLTGAARAVYFYAGVPTDTEKHFHGHANEVVVRISGDDLLAQHPGRLHHSPRDSAVAVRGGYRGPGTVETTTGGETGPPRRTAAGWVTVYIRTLVVGR